MVSRLAQETWAPRIRSRIAAAYDKQADPVIEIQLEKAGVRLAYLLNAALK